MATRTAKPKVSRPAAQRILPYVNKDSERIGLLDPLIVGRANVVYEQGEHQLNLPIL